MTKRRKPKIEQLLLGRFWGQRRPGGGRKPNLKKGVPHAKREELAHRFPVHVTLKLRRSLPRLRTRACYRVLCEAFDNGCDRPGRLREGRFGLVQYSVQNDHLHLIVEAQDRLSLARGIQGLSIRIAKGLNRLWKRRGRVFADRYHDHILRTPREVWNALKYVLHNGFKHRQHSNARPDVFSSGAWFDGWRDYVYDGFLGPEGPIVRAGTWLLNIGWRRYGRIPITP